MSADALSCRSPNRTPHRRTHRGELEPAQGRSPLGFTAWNAMRNWMQSTHADVYFLQEAMARDARPCSRPASAHRWTTRSTTSGTARPPRSRMRSTGRSRSGRTCSRRGGTAMRSCHRIRSTSAAAGTSPRTVSSARPAGRARDARGRPPGHAACALALTRAARLRQMHWIAHWIVRNAGDGPLMLAGDFNDWRNDSVALFGEIGLSRSRRCSANRAARSRVLAGARARQDVRARADAARMARAVRRGRVAVGPPAVHRAPAPRSAALPPSARSPDRRARINALPIPLRRRAPPTYLPILLQIAVVYLVAAITPGISS